VALLGLPPFSLFASEVGLARAAAAAGLGWVIAVALTLLVVIFVAVTVQVTPMILGSTQGAAAAPDRPAASGRVASGSTAPLVVALVVLAAVGIVSWPLDQLLHSASLIGSGQ
jgi:hydrogenase-4 component F